jgi:Flp pilus assembly protein TadG
MGHKPKETGAVDAPSRAKRFIGAREGSVAIMFALAVMPLLFATGIAIDYARAISARLTLQQAVDSAAMAGARLPATANQNRIAAATHMFKANLASSALSGVEPNITASNAEVSVEASYAQPTSFTKLMGIDSITVHSATTARSQVENGGVACLLALNPTTPDGLHLQGINKQSAENCWAWVNSTNPTAINAVGASTGTAQGFCTAGGVVGAEHFTPMPYTGCDQMADPFRAKFDAYVAPTALCTALNTNVQLKSGTFVLTPGHYCGNLVLNSHADVTFLPGTYYIKGGYFEIQAGASAKGDGVTFVFVGSNSRMEVRGGGSVDFTAPKSGDLAGFVLVDLWAANKSVSETVIQGGGTVKLQGVLYAPLWRVNISGNGDINQSSEYFAMVADNFYMEGNGTLYLKTNAAAVGLPDLMPKIKNGPVLLE